MNSRHQGFGLGDGGTGLGAGGIDQEDNIFGGDFGGLIIDRRNQIGGEMSPSIIGLAEYGGLGGIAGHLVAEDEVFVGDGVAIAQLNVGDRFAVRTIAPSSDDVMGGRSNVTDGQACVEANGELNVMTGAGYPLASKGD